MTIKKYRIIIGVVVFSGLWGIAQIIWWCYILLNPPLELHRQFPHYHLMIIGETFFFLLFILIPLLIVVLLLLREIKFLRITSVLRDYITHSMKTPLSRINLFIENLPDNELKNHLKKSVIDIYNHIENALALFKSGSPGQKQQINLNSFIKEIIDNYLPYFNSIVELEIPAGIVINTPYLYFKAVIENLLLNAFKYSPPESKIHVSFSVDNHTGKLQIKNPLVNPVNKEGSGLLIVKEISRWNNWKFKYKTENNHFIAIIEMPLKN